MEVETTLSQAIDVSDQKSQYDKSCKRILSEKIILAWIMKHTMKEYKNYSEREIAGKFIPGTTIVAEKGVLPDETNVPRINGTGVEDCTITEGKITYDVLFHAIIPDTKEIVQMIINVEAQNKYNPGYPLIKRGIYYAARMISSQYGTVFTSPNYEKIQKVYSVWICPQVPKERKNTITEYCLTEKQHIGNVKEVEEMYDLISVIMICLGDDEDESDNQLIRMLDVLLSNEKSAEEKKTILKNEFNFPINIKFEKELETMCNLSEGVEQKGIEKGIEKEALDNARELLKNGVQFEVVRRSIRSISDEKLKQLYDEVMAERNR